MVRYANRSRTAIRFPKRSTPCVTHHFPRFASRTLRLATAASSWQGYDQGRRQLPEIPSSIGVAAEPQKGYELAAVQAVDHVQPSFGAISGFIGKKLATHGRPDVQ